MSKKIILNDNEVVFNEDVAQAQDWRQRDFNRFLESQRSGLFGHGPIIVGTVASATMSGLEIVRSAGDLTVIITPGTAIFGFGGTDTTVNNRYQLSSAEEPVNLTLTVADPLLTRWDLIEVSAQKVVSSEIRRVLSPGPTRRLVPVLLPKVEENRLVFRVRSGTGALLGTALIPPLRPDLAWLPLYAVQVLPLSLIASTAVTYDLRLWLSNFSVSGATSSFTDGWRSPPSAFLESPSVISVNANVVTMTGYSSPVASNQVGFNSLLSLDINRRRPPGISAYVVDRWYYIYATRPHRNCGITTLSISESPPLPGSSPDGTRFGISLSAPWPSDSSSRSRYLCAVRLYEIGGGNFGIRDFVRVGNYVPLTSYLYPSGPPGAAHPNVIVDSLTPSVILHSTRINLGIALVPPHTKLVRTSWYVKATGGTAYFAVLTSTNFVLNEFQIVFGDTMCFTVDIPMPLDGSTEFKYRVGVNQVSVKALVTGYYEDLA